MKKAFILLFVFYCSQLYSQISWKDISAGTEFSVAIDASGALWTWGFNGNGQLGHGYAELSSELPQQVGTDNDWARVEAGAFHTLALKEDGTLWAWGFNNYGQVGNGNVAAVNEPIQIGMDNDWSVIAAGQVNSAAIKTDGTLWTWGYHGFSQLGYESEVDVNVPTQVLQEGSWIDVAIGGMHVLALKNDGTLYGWGINANHQLGIITESDHVVEPTLIDSDTWSSISAGFEFSAGIKENGTMWSWGFNGNGQLGIGNTTEQTQPVQVGIDNTWNYVDAAGGNILAIRSDLTLHGAGFNHYGQLGLGNTSAQNTLTMISPSMDWIKVVGAQGTYSQNGVLGAHTLAIHDNGEHLCVAGANYVGQLGYTNEEQLVHLSCFIALSNREETEMTSSLTVYPNPANNLLNLEMDAATIQLIELFDVTGKRVLSTSANTNRANIYLDGLPSGIYQLKAQVEDGIITKKIVKQ